MIFAQRYVLMHSGKERTLTEYDSRYRAADREWFRWCRFCDELDAHDDHDAAHAADQQHRCEPARDRRRTGKPRGPRNGWTETEIQVLITQPRSDWPTLLPHRTLAAIRQHAKKLRSLGHGIPYIRSPRSRRGETAA